MKKAGTKKIEDELKEASIVAYPAEPSPVGKRKRLVKEDAKQAAKASSYNEEMEEKLKKAKQGDNTDGDAEKEDGDGDGEGFAEDALDIDVADTAPELDEDDAFDLDSLGEEGSSGGTYVVPAQGHMEPGGARDALSLYLREISRFPMLTPDEEHSLALRVKNGDSEAAFRLVSSHLRLVVRIAMDFQRRWMQNVLDLIQEGNVGLMRATGKFDPEKGIKFSYYAAFWIKAYILKFIMDNWRMVKIGTTQTQRKLFYNLNKERQRLMAQGFEVDDKTLAQNLGVSEENIREMTMRMDGSDVSLDVPVSDDTNFTRMDFLPSLVAGTEESLATGEVSTILSDELEKIIPKLSTKERDILKLRLLSDDPVTLREIGAKYDITRERVRQIETRLLEKLKIHLSKEIEDFSEDWIDE